MPMKKVPKPSNKATSKLRSLLFNRQTNHIIEAHNGISARIVEQSGAQGIWASGLAISAQFGVRDNNEASWTQIVEMLEFMSDATKLPILVDGDTGYGNFNNMRRLVAKLEQRSIAGVCIEDKEFPKTNSFINGHRQQLADIDEFCGKIQAGKDSQASEEFCIVARTEALIAGFSMKEALRRCERYRQAGADAVLIHSKSTQPDEILEFARHWEQRCPVVIVPTTYYSTPTEVFERAGINLIIWANQTIRASIINMQKICREIVTTRSARNVEERITPMHELFALQGADELAAAENRYLLSRKSTATAIVLAASRGNALRELTEDRPKIMLSIGGKSLLQRMLDVFKSSAVQDITVVGGYKASAIPKQGLRVIINKRWEKTSELASLLAARKAFGDDMIISYGDLLMRQYILQNLMALEKDLVVVVDSAPQKPRSGESADYAWCNKPDDRSLFGQDVRLKRIAPQPDALSEQPSGRWIGLLRINGKGRKWLDEALDRLSQRKDADKLAIPDLINDFIKKKHPVHVHYIHGHWLDINRLDDLEVANRFAGE
ncbi:MAG: phosphoenolpyruvate mutase [Candidatus Eutrophobiaceae bacterium]